MLFLLVVFFHFGMLLGFLLLAAFWAAGGHRSLPMGVVFIFIFGLPFAGWLIGSLGNAPIILIVPVSFGAAFAWSYRSRRFSQQLDRAGRADKLLTAQRQLHEDPANAGALLTRAEVFEEDGRFEEARADYQRAFGASDRALSRYALKDHEERLDHAIKAREARLEYEKRFFVHFLRAAKIEWGLVAAGVLVALGSPPNGAALVSMGLMTGWCRRLTGF